MKFLISTVSYLLLATAAHASDPCGPPKLGVTAVISGYSIADNGQTFCYATEVVTGERYPVSDCGFQQNDDVVEGTVRTYWTHLDDRGNPVCDYQMFSIDRP